MPKTANSALPKSFEAALAELETVVQAMEGGKLGLDESLASYQRGAELLTFCRKALDAADQRVRVLEADLAREFPQNEPSEE